MAVILVERDEIHCHLGCSVLARSEKMYAPVKNRIRTGIVAYAGSERAVVSNAQ